ncbi:MAG: saccharopine dehydrogenase NADP-binding domain-containing protein [Bacteroidota bacterium]|nr:saccharopine dehydrogenase NADP-binding domain-containing protein [Bacteroidota bacterium]
MSTILLFGAGKSTTSLIDYLGKTCEENNWKIFVCDADISLAQSKTNQFSCAEAISFDVTNPEKRHKFISQADIVISMLPPSLHFLVAKDCLAFSKNLLTASYIDTNIRSLSDEIEAKGLLFIGEMGLDPGIDHMSAMKMINEIKSKGGTITSFKSHCGGLMSPESDDNPWHYKISWNPINVVAAGSSGAFYKEKGEIKEVLYSHIFEDEGHIVDVPGIGTLAWYANRDSLSYIDTYNLHGVHTFLRTTLRYPAFCRGWNKVVHLDLTNKNDHEEIKHCKTFADWFELKKQKLINQQEKNFDENDFFNAEFVQQLDFLSIRSDEKLPEPVPNSASLLQYLLEKNLVMKPTDQDMIIMLHEIKFSVEGKDKETRSCLIVKGEDKTHTAMAKTVGLPLGIAAMLILKNKINVKGLHIPVIPEIYEPVLAGLELNGIKFKEETIDL